MQGTLGEVRDLQSVDAGVRDLHGGVPGGGNSRVTVRAVRTSDTLNFVSAMPLMHIGCRVLPLAYFVQRARVV